MTRIDIFSGFLGAGKTTLIKKMIREAYRGEKLVLIENEFGEIGIDGGFMKEVGIEINEMNSGCICCSLVGDFTKALQKVMAEYSPDRILIEPSGVGKLSDVVSAVQASLEHGAELGCLVTVADAKKCKMYMKNFGEFYNDQVQTAKTIILSRTAGMTQDKLQDSVELLRAQNPDAVIVTTPWDELTGTQLLDAMESTGSFAQRIMEDHEHHHHHDDKCHCHDHEHHHHHDDKCHCHEHEHHHHHDDACHCHEHEHHHHHDDKCHCHDREHHHADEVFSSWGKETPKLFTKQQITDVLAYFAENEDAGVVLRAKGIVASAQGWIHFDYVPGESDVRLGTADVTGRICVIGSCLDGEKLAALFMV